mgnify:FL=1
MSARLGIVCYDAHLLGCRRIKRPLPKEAAVLFAVRSRLLNDRDRGIDIVLYGYAVRTAVGGG